MKGGEKMELKKKLIAIGTTVTMLSTILTGTALADEGNNHSNNYNENHEYRHEGQIFMLAKNQQQQDYSRNYRQDFENWFQQKGYQWDNSRDMEKDWSDFQDWCNHMNNNWQSRSYDEEKSDFMNWFHEHHMSQNADNNQNHCH
jgi:hypothetical protein